MTHSFNHLIYCPVPPSSPLPILPSEGGIPCIPVVPYEEPLGSEENAHLGRLRKNTFKLTADQELCKQHSISCKDFTFTPVDFATHLPDREAWIIGSQTRPSSIPKHDIDIRFYLENPAQRFATKAALLQKIESIIVGFIQGMHNQTASSSSPAESMLLKVFGVKIQIFGLPDHAHRPSWALIQLGDVQINAIYRTRTHSLSSSTGGQWNILRSVVRWTTGHSFALNSHAFTLAKNQAMQRICHILYPQFTHNLLYRIMLEASHGSIFLPAAEKSSSLLAVALDKFFVEHALDFKLNAPIVITKNLLRYFKEHARTPHKRLADFIYLLSSLQHQPQACALLCQAFLDIARQHDKDVHIASLAPFAEFLCKHATETPAFLAVLYGLCVCCKWANQTEGVKGEIGAYTFSFAEKERAFFTFKGAFFALPADYPSILDLSHMLLTNWMTIFKHPESTRCLQGLFDLLELSSVYLHADPSISLKAVKAALLLGAQQAHVRQIVDRFHGPGAAEAWFLWLRNPELRKKDSKEISSEGQRLLTRLRQVSESFEKQGQVEIAMWFKTLCKLGDTPSRTEELFKLLNNLWSHIQALSKKTELFESVKRPLNDFLRYYLGVLEKQVLPPALPALMNDFYFSIQDFLSREVRLNFFFTLMVTYEKEHPQMAQRLIMHGLQNAFFSNADLWLTEYYKLFSSTDPLMLRQVVQLSGKALKDSADDKVRLEWLPLLMQKLFEAKCYSDACALLLHIRHHDKALLKFFLESENHQGFRKQLLEAASLDLRAIEPETSENAYRVLCLILSGTPASALVTEISQRLSLEISERFLKSDIPKPSIAVRYNMLRLVHQLLYAQGVFSTDTKIACFRYLILKCLETRKKRPHSRVQTSYRSMAVRTLKNLAASAISLSSELELKLSDLSSYKHEMQKTFLLRMKSALTRKVTHFHFLGKVLLENILSDKSPKEGLGRLLSSHLTKEEFSEAFSAFVVSLDPSLAEHPVFKRETFLPDSLENIEIPEAEEKEVKKSAEKADPREDAFIEGINPKQSDASPHFVRMRRVIAWLLKPTSPKGKTFSENLFHSRLFIVNSLTHGKKRFLALPAETRLSLAQNLLQAIKNISEMPRQGAKNEAYELFAFWTIHSAQYFTPLNPEHADLFAQDCLKIASTLTQELLFRAKKEPEKVNTKALHFLTFFLLNLNLSSGLAYELLIQTIALLPRKPPFGLAYPQAVEKVRHMIAQAKEPHTRALLQETVLKLIQEGVQPHTKDYLSLAIQLWGEVLSHRLIIADHWEPVGKMLQLLTDKLANSKTPLPQESLCHLIVEPLAATQMLSACSEATRYAVLRSLTDSLFPEALPKLLPAVKDQLDYLLWRRLCPDITPEQCHLLAERLPDIAALAIFPDEISAKVNKHSIPGLDTALTNLHATCRIFIYMGCGSLDHLNQAMQVYQTLDLDEQLKIVSAVLEGFFAYPKLEDVGGDNLGKVTESLHRLTEGAKLTPDFWQKTLPKMTYFFGRFKTAPHKEQLELLELNFLRHVINDNVPLPSVNLKMLIVRLLEVALTFSDLKSTQLAGNALCQLFANLPSDLRLTCFENTLETFILREFVKSNNMLDQLKERALRRTSTFSQDEIGTFFNRLQRLLMLETIIPIDVPFLNKLLESFFACAQSMNHALSFSQMSTLLDFASTEGYFRHLESQKAPPSLANLPHMYTNLKNTLMDLHFMTLDFKRQNSSAPLDTLVWLGKLRKLYPKLAMWPGYKNMTVAAFEAFSCIFLNEDPQKSSFSMQEMEALFKLACQKNDKEFAYSCYSFLIGNSCLYAAIPHFIKLLSKRKPHEVKAFMKSTDPHPRKFEFPLILEGDFKYLVRTVRHIFKSYEDMQQLLKYVEDPAYIRGIAEVSLQGLKAVQRCLLEYNKFPARELALAFRRPLKGGLHCIPLLLKEHLSAKNSLSPYKAEQVIKQCAAWKTYWKPFLINAELNKPLPYTPASVPIDILCGDISVQLFEVRQRVVNLWEEYKPFKSPQVQLLDQSLTSFMKGYNLLLLPACRIDNAEACYINACDLTLQIERLRKKNPPQTGERKVEANPTETAMWQTLEKWESLAVHIADLIADLFQAHTF